MEGVSLVKKMLSRQGVRNKLRAILILRFELIKFLESAIDEEDHEHTLLGYCKVGGPESSSIKRRMYATVFSYHILRNYRG